ncbi:hypothetical protein [Mucilaginibacter paludis]|uniref:Uncharacterized protein n=1 Tax=Mucilaginibacter paludis DSM 18603 TaxID=714943 RepID=H1YGJ3_9SPHI|nr:hypothetical protein [Mucilaginibacter paludis]EHQ25379.1 hypothetical protein Mucpa_1215 [Mucilaginibacter paludis DSM 18603]
MAQTNKINDKRLTKRQVLEIIKTEGKFHDEYTKFFEEKYTSGFVQQDKVYELPGERYLYVFDEKELSIGGKGDIFSKDDFNRRVRWHKRVREDYANDRRNSVDHWRFYSKYKNDFIGHIKEHIVSLAKQLGVDGAILDCTYESLDLVTNGCMQYEIEELFNNLYDNLVAYVGEVIRKRVNGTWDTNNIADPYPLIRVHSKRIQYMPINVVWGTLNGLKNIDFRKETANEVRRHAFG